MPRQKVVLNSEQCAAALKTMGDGTRLRILELLLAKPQCVSDIVKALRYSQPHVSHHLQVLRENGLVERHRKGRQVHYRVAHIYYRILDGKKPLAMDFGCCEVRFPVGQSLVMPLKMNRSGDVSN